MVQTRIKIQTEDFDIAAETQHLEADNISDGALVTFTGRVRNNNNGNQVSQLFLEHYQGMTEKCLANIVDQARERWQLGNVGIIHRIGQLNLGENIVFVGVTSKHRKDAFHGAEFIMDYLKTQAPFWKKERSDEGEQWLDAKQSDATEAQKWS